MKLTLSPISLCRTPVFSVHQELSQVWDELKGYIHESSPAFFEIIKDLQYPELESAEPKTRFTVWKYFNRAKFRATPYGGFAAFSLVPVCKEKGHTGAIAIEHKTTQYRFPDWQEKENINQNADWLSLHSGFLRANTSTYITAEDIRYISETDGLFELSAITAEQTIISMLTFCGTKRSITAVRDFLYLELGFKKGLINNFLEQLIDFQLLVSDLRPNIIGTDYFKRINYPDQHKKTDYIISERKIVSGQLPAEKFNILTEVAGFLGKHTYPEQNQSLKNFKEKFKKTFENKEIPLLVAIDPELGLGYKALETDKQEDQLIQELKANQRQAKSIQNLKYTPLHQFMLNQMITHKNIQLHDFKDPGNEQALPLANTISTLVQYTDDYIILDNIGGYTANSLLGRFSMAGEAVAEHCAAFVKIEEEANPDVLFFDIAYQHDKKADNVNRRKSIYSYELPILSWTDNQQVIDLNDIMVSIKKDDLILYSLKYGKRIVPKSASAYNYSRSDLAVYRFLSDLQHQHINSSLGIDLKNFFPGLVHYPRVQYKNVVLSTEKWEVPKQICTAANTTEALKLLTEWLAGIALKGPFKCGAGDQTLLFKPDVKEDLLSFAFFCKNRTGLYIEETFIPVTAVVTDENNQPYLPEFIISLQHNQQIYEPYTLKAPATRPADGNIFLPGGEWLYFEIYCHTSRANAVLSKLTREYLNVFRKQIKNSFFIRYSDPSSHLRVRIQLKNIADTQLLLTGFSEVLKPAITSGLIRDLQVKTYQRESERYGGTRIALVEKWFGINSDFIFSLLAKQATANDYYSLSITMLENVLEKAGYTLPEQLYFVEMMADLFAAEMNIRPEGFKKLNQTFKDFSVATDLLKLNKLQSKKAVKTETVFLEVLNTCPAAEQHNLLADLFHMHTNRLFENEQRMHEMVMYYYLTKRLKMKIGRLRNQN